MTDLSPWARIVDIQITEGKAKLVLDFAGERLTTPEIDGDKCNKLALAMLALAAIDERADMRIPYLGTFRLGNLADAGATLLTFFPGDLATKGIAGLLP